jgi:hypothetical protein
MSSKPVCEVSKKMFDLEQRSITNFLLKKVRSQRRYLNAWWQFMGSLPLLTIKSNFGVNNLSGGESRLKMTLTLGVLWKRLLKKCVRNWKV